MPWNASRICLFNLRLGSSSSRVLSGEGPLCDADEYSKYPPEPGLTGLSTSSQYSSSKVICTRRCASLVYRDLEATASPSATTSMTGANVACILMASWRILSGSMSVKQFGPPVLVRSWW